MASVANDLSWLPAELDSVALRLSRADALLFELGQLALAWSHNALDMREVERGEDEVELVVGAIREIPPNAAMLFSEAVNHLRAALDNAVFKLVELTRGAALPDSQAKAIDFPIRSEQAGLDDWQKKLTRKGVVEVGPNSQLARRILGLQPYVDRSANVPSISPLLATLTGMASKNAHPLLLLQEYSNTDKHRSMRMAAVRTIVSRYGEPFWDSDRKMRPIAVGDVLGSTRRGEPAIIEAQSALHVLRPDDTTWVAPVAELTHVHRHVADIVIPTLVTGFALPGSLPPAVDLADSGLSARARLVAGAAQHAFERIGDDIQTAYANGFEPELRFPSTRDPNEPATEQIVRGREG